VARSRFFLLSHKCKMVMPSTCPGPAASFIFLASAPAPVAIVRG
jgi:hypothetical protein